MLRQEAQSIYSALERRDLLKSMAACPDLFKIRPGQGWDDEPYQRSR